jgi:hypothetical protein
MNPEEGLRELHKRLPHENRIRVRQRSMRWTVYAGYFIAAGVMGWAAVRTGRAPSDP